MADPDDDLDNLVSELNLTAAPAATRLTADLSPKVETWLGRVRELDGSDLLVAGAPPMIRAAGRMGRASDEILDGDDIERPGVPLAGPRLLQRYRDGGSVDLAFKLPALGRFRMNLHHERGRAAAAIRALPKRLPALTGLGFTHDVGVLARLPRGLLLVGG